MSADTLRLGEFAVRALRDGWLEVDGRAMFGGPVEARWAASWPRGARRGRLDISLNAFLITGPAGAILVDTGAGEALSGRLRRSYAFRQDPGLVEALGRIGFRPDDIGLVINTHLHFDHCGGNVRRSEDGGLEPAFPRAAYIVQRGERSTALDPPRRERLNYLPSCLRPVEARGQLRMVDGDAAVCPGVEVLFAPGHTRHHQCVKLESAGRSLLILGDLVPTSAHVSLSRTSSYDLDPAELAAVKRRLLGPEASGPRLVAFGHDPVHPFGRVEAAGGRWTFRPLDE